MEFYLTWNMARIKKILRLMKSCLIELTFVCQKAHLNAQIKKFMYWSMKTERVFLGYWILLLWGLKNEKGDWPISHVCVWPNNSCSYPDFSLNSFWPQARLFVFTGRK